MRWIACTYSSPKAITYLQSDDSGLDSLKNLLMESDNRVVYGVLTVKISGIVRWVFYSYIGEAVSGMNRAKVSMHKSGISNYFVGIINSYSLSEPDDLDDENLVNFFYSTGGFDRNSINLHFSCDESKSDGFNLLQKNTASAVCDYTFDEWQLMIFPEESKPLEELLEQDEVSSDVHIFSSLQHNSILWRNIAAKAPPPVFSQQNQSTNSDMTITDIPDDDKFDSDFPKCLKQYMTFHEKNEAALVASRITESTDSLMVAEENENGTSDKESNEDFVFPYTPRPNLSDLLQVQAYIAKSQQNLSTFMAYGGDKYLLGLWNKYLEDDITAKKLSPSTVNSGSTLTYVAIVECLLSSISQTYESSAPGNDGAQEGNNKPVGSTSANCTTSSELSSPQNDSEVLVKNLASKSQSDGNKISTTSPSSTSPPKHLSEIMAQRKKAHHEEISQGSTVQLLPSSANLLANEPSHLVGLIAAKVKLQQKLPLEETSSVSSPSSAPSTSTTGGPSHLAGLVDAMAKIQQKESSDKTATSHPSPTSTGGPNHLAGLMAARAKIQQKESAEVAVLSESATTSHSSDEPNHLAGLMAARAKIQKKEASKKGSTETGHLAGLIAAKEKIQQKDVSGNANNEPNHLAELMAARVKIQKQGSLSHQTESNSPDSTSSCNLDGLIANRARIQRQSSEESKLSSSSSPPLHLEGLFVAREKLQQKHEGSPESITTTSSPNHLEGLMAARAKVQQANVKNTERKRTVDEEKGKVDKDEGAEEAGLTKVSTRPGDVTTVHRMRGCFWEPLSNSDEKQSIFCRPYNKLDNDSDELVVTVPETIFDILREEFTQIIKKRELTEAERIGQSVGAIGGTLAKGSLTFMDQRRFNNIAIKLRQMNRSNEFLRVAVLSLDEDFLTMDRVNALLACAPNGDDLESIEPYDGDPELLATCERFFYDIQHVPFFTRRIEAYKAKLEISTEVDELIKVIGNLGIAVHSIFFSKSLPQLSMIVLQIGNFMNAGTSRENARSFDISFLPKLSYIKSGNLRSNLMKFIVSFLMEQHPSLLDSLFVDLSVCDNASKYSYKQIDVMMTLIKKKINIIKTVTTSVKFKNKKGKVDPADSFEEKMSSFLTAIDILMNVLVTGLVDRLKKSVGVLFKCYGVQKEEGEEDYKPEAFFAMLRELSNNLTSAKHALIQDAIAEKIKRLQMEAHAATIEARKNKVVDKYDISGLGEGAKQSRAGSAELTATSRSKTKKISLVDKPPTAQEAFETLISQAKKSLGQNRKNRSVDADFIREELKALDNTIAVLSPKLKATTKKTLMRTPSSSDMAIGSLCISSECVDTWNKIQEDSGHMNWFAMRLDYDSNSLVLCHYGFGGLEELKEYITEEVTSLGIPLPSNSYVDETKKGKVKKNKIVYTGPLVACLRVTGVDGLSRRHKFISIYVNPGKFIPIRLRGQVSQCRESVQKFLNIVHVELHTESFMSDISKETVTKRLLESGGAHCPQYYEV